RRDRLHEFLRDARQIRGMNRSVRAPLPHGLQRLAAVPEEFVVNEFELAGGSQGGNEAWNRVHDEARLALALSHGLLRPLALGQVEDEGHTLAPSFLEGRATEQHGHAAAVLPEILLLERSHAPGHPVLTDHLCIALAPVGWRQIRPAETAVDDVVAVVSDHAQKRVISLEDAAVEIPDEDPDDVRVDQAPDLRLALLDMPIQPCVLQRHRGLRGEQSQDRDAVRGEDTRGQVVLEVEDSREPALLQQRQTEHRAGTSVAYVSIRREDGMHGGIVQDDALLRPQDVTHNRLRDRGGGPGSLVQTN